jgi:hypothetical protein
VILQVLDLSTAHLPPHIRDGLPRYAGVVAYSLSTSDDQYGWLLWVPYSPDGHASDRRRGASAGAGDPALRPPGRGCDYVLLDRDAEKVAELPTWDW